MLSLPDAEIVSRDPALPGLRLALDPESLVRALRHARPGLDVRRSRLAYVRYKPGTDCLATHTLTLPAGELVTHVKTYGRHTVGKLRKLRERAQAPSPLGPGRVFLDDGLTVVGAFPDDARLRGLARLHDPQRRLRILRELFPMRKGDDGEAHLLVYKPERRCVLRWDEDGVPTAVVKLYTPSGYLGALAGARAFASGRRLRIARRLGACERYGAIAWEWVEGTSLSDVLAAETLDWRALTDVGAALAELHDQDAPGLAVVAPEDEAEALLRFAAGLDVLGSTPAARAAGVAERLAARLASAREEQVPVHGDFYAKQVLLSSRGATVLDLDEAVRAHPATDLANFVAHLERSALRGEIDPERALEARAALEDGYREATGGWLPDLGPFVAARLLRLILDPFRHREADWPERAARILDRAEALEARPRPARACTTGGAQEAMPGPRPTTALDPSMPFMEAALDRGTAASWLGRLPAFAGAGLRVREARLTRHKRGRRCVIEYEVESSATAFGATVVTVVAKARARGTDERTCMLMRALWRAGFQDGSADGISIPEPLGCVREANMWVQRKAPGRPSMELLSEPGGVSLARRMAAAIRKLQAVGPQAGRVHDLAAELRLLRARLTLLGRARPAWSARVERLLQACARLADGVPVPTLRAVHRDFHPDQVLVDGERLYLLDFDLYADGDPALDAGNLSAHLRERAVREPHLAPSLHAAADVLLAACAGAASLASWEALHAYESLSLVRLIDLSTRFPERRPFTRDLLELCESRLLGGGSRRARPRTMAACAPEGGR
jgi:thiamine kinase-like enzyme